MVCVKQKWIYKASCNSLNFAFNLKIFFGTKAQQIAIDLAILKLDFHCRVSLRKLKGVNFTDFTAVQ